jgi:Prealbumin-like fold domain
MRKGKRKTSVVAMMAVLASLLLPVLAAGPAQAVAPDHVSSTLQGCKPTAGSYQTSPQVICTVNGNYTSGNLGKSWNELDLVPYRITMDAGNAAPATQVYTIAIVLDGVDAGKPGYDVISPATLNAALSDDSATNCLVSSGAQTNKNPGFGGTDTSIYRLVTITQQKNTTCVFDWFGRLALGSHLFPGSSLHANIGNEAVTQGGSDVSIPVNQISPQELRKTMSALQDSDVSWDITKEATPAHLDFENVCDPDVPASLETSIKITWTKNAAVGGNILVTTHIFAKNPAARPITTNVTDVIKSGATVLDTKVFAPVVVPANTETEILPAHTFTVPAGTTNLNDTATATYTDTITNIPIPGNVQASASAIVQGGNVTNNTAVITDVEKITGAGLAFSVAAPSVGSFTNYTAGDKVDATGSVEWSSGTVSASGSVTFTKTVYLDAAGGATSGTLDDTATLTGSDAFTTKASASVDIDSTLSGSLVINKTTTVPVDGDTTFEFEVNPGGIPVTVTIPDGGTSGTSDALTGLTANDYTVTETNSNGFTPAADQNFTIGAGNCSAELSFENTFGPATAQVFKVTVPAGSEAGFEFSISGPGGFSDTGTADATGTVQWTTAGSDTLTLADEGQYTVTETPKSGFDLTNISVNDNGNGSGATDLNAGTCSFSVDYPGDADGVFSCTYTNTQRGSITLTKVTSPAGSDQSFEFIRDFGTSPVSLKDGQSDKVGNLVAGTYSASETVPDGWDLTSFVCDDGSDPSAINLAAGEDIICTATNVRQVGNIVIRKVTDPDTDSTTDFSFTSDFMGNFTLKNGEFKDSGPLPTGVYSVDETPVPAGWDLDSFICDDGSPINAINLGKNETVVCTATNVQQGTIIVKKITDPANSTEKFTFTGDAAGTIDNSQQIKVENLAPGTYTSTETAKAGWDLTKIECDDDNSTGTGNNTATFKLEAGETVTCTFTNKEQTGRIIVTKVTDPTSATQKFEFHTNYKPNFSLGNGESDNSGPLTVNGGPYSVAEINVPAGWVLKSLTCDGNNPNPLAIALESGETVTCTATNQQQAKISVQKTFQGGTSANTYTFELRQGAVDSDPGSGDDTPGVLKDTKTITANNTPVQLNSFLAPGTYQVCEVGVAPGANVTFTGGTGNPFNLTLGGDNSRLCINVEVKAGDNLIVKADNTPPPGGEGRTIGFWKNWASCKTSNGKQAPVLDQTLAKADPAGIVLGDLTLHGADCVKARNILDKTTIDGKTKKSSDPLFNMAAQLLAAKLNVVAGAATCPAATNAITAGSALLAKYHWNGLTYSPALTAADKALANSLNTTLDQYNNGNLC